MSDQTKEDSEEKEEKYESPEALTSFKKGPPWFDRRKVMMTLAIAFATVVIAGVIFSTGTTAKKEAQEANDGYAANVPRDFLQREYERSLQNRPEESSSGDTAQEEGTSLTDISPSENESALPKAVPVSLYERPPPAQVPPPQYYPPPPAQNSTYQTREAPQTNPYVSPLVARIEGSLFTPAAPGTETPGEQVPAQYPVYPGSGVEVYPSSVVSPAPPQAQNNYAMQNNQANKIDFYDSGSGGGTAGVFLKADMLWIGTMIPAVLETAINTDLPGNVIARVTENIFDSQTGRKMLVPQGTILIAQYNSSVSYAQKRVQIVWDVLIRPDGYQLELEGMNGVDPKGMAGIKADYRENWFEYIKAAGLIAMFSVANSKMTEQVAKYGSDDMAGGVASGNAELIGEVGGNIVSRAMDIQPTLLVNSGERINIMLNKNLSLPPMKNYPVTQKYSLK